MCTRQMSQREMADEFTAGSRVAFDNDHYGGTGEVEDIVHYFNAKEGGGYKNCSILIKPGPLFNMKTSKAMEKFAETGGYVTIDLYSVNTRIDRIVCNVKKIQPEENMFVLHKPCSSSSSSSTNNDSFIDCF